MWNVTDQTRLAVWNTLCDLEWNVRYYTELASGRRRAHWRLRFAILAGVLADGMLFYVGASHPPAFYAGVAIGVLLAIGTIWDAMSNYAESAAVARLTAYGCDDLYREAERLWRDVQNDAISNDDAEAQHRSITDRWARATERISLDPGESFRKKTADDSSESVESRYAT